MRQVRLTTTTIITILLLTTCQHREINTQLTQADSLMPIRPDSALHILQRINIKQLKDKKEQAYYALLLTQAKDKNYITPLNDSLINSAVTYYDSIHDIIMQAKAHFYKGSVWRDKNNSPKAMKEFLTTISLAKQTNNKKLLSFAYNNIANLYYNQELNTKADSTYQLTKQLAITRKDTTLWIECLSKQSMLQLKRGEKHYEEAEEKMTEALNIFKSTSNRRLKAYATYTLSVLYHFINKEDEAIEYAKRNIALQKDTSTCYNSFLLLGDAYYMNKQNDSALIYLYKSLPSNDYGIKARAYMRLTAIAKEQNQLKTALEMEKRYIAYRDSIQLSRQSNDLIAAEKDTQILHYDQEYQSLKKRQLFYLLLLLSIAIGCIAITISLRKAYLKKNRLLKDFQVKVKEEQSLQHKYAQLQLSVQQKEREIVEMQNSIIKSNHIEIEKEKLNLKKEIDSLNKERSAILRTAYENSDIYAKMKCIINSCKECDQPNESFSENDWKQLIAETDRQWDNITIRLLSHYPSLSQEDIRLCCLLLTDFPIQHLSYLIPCSRNAIYKRENVIVERKMGFPHKATSLKEILKDLQDNTD